MTIEWNDIARWIWTAPLAILGGSFEFRLKNKVSKETCSALRSGLVNEMNGVKKHVDDKFDDWKEFYQQQTKIIVGEIKKNNGR